MLNRACCHVMRRCSVKKGKEKKKEVTPHSASNCSSNCYSSNCRLAHPFRKRPGNPQINKDVRWMGYSTSGLTRGLSELRWTTILNHVLLLKKIKRWSSTSKVNTISLILAWWPCARGRNGVTIVGKSRVTCQGSQAGWCSFVCEFWTFRHYICGTCSTSSHGGCGE